MDRTQAIELIAKRLSDLNDGQVQTVAKFVAEIAERLPRELTPREQRLIAQSREDFRMGRTLSLDEMDKFLDAAAAERNKARVA
jgi:hypothetical protein